MFWDRSCGPFPAFFISIYILMHNFNTSSPLIYLDSHGHSKISKKILTIRSQVLGPIKRPLTTSNQRKHGKTLKNGNKTQAGRNTTSWSCQKLTNPGSTRSLLCVERFPFLLRRNPTVRSPVFLERSALSL